MPHRSTRPAQLRPEVAPDDLRHAAYAAAPVAVRRALRAQVVADCEDRPGVYRMLGATGLVLYVGKAKRLRTRLLSYFRAAAKNRRRDKQSRILRHAHTLEWEYTHDEFAALLRELRLIKRHRPRFNVLMNLDEPPRGWLALTDGPVPGLRVVQRTDAPDAALLYGPFRRIATLTEAVRALADVTGVRDCLLPTSQLGGLEARMAERQVDGAMQARRAASSEETAPTEHAVDARATADDATHATTRAAGAARVPRPRRRRTAPADLEPRPPACLRYELGTCPGPCTAARALPWPDAPRHDAAVAEARDFLAGRTRAPLDRLRAAMTEAADAWHFERAGSLKGRLEALAWLADRLSRFHAGADRLSFVYRATGSDGTDRLYLIRRGTVRAECALPADAAAQAELVRLVRRVFEGADPSGADIPTHDLDEFYLVASWFRRHADARERATPPDAWLAAHDAPTDPR